MDPLGKGKAQTRSTDTNVLDVSDRLYFQQALQTRKRYINAAVVSRLPGSPILFFVSKPVFDAKGELLFVVVIGMETSQLISFYSLFDFSLAPAISIFKKDGGIVARHPGMKELVGQSNAKSQIFTTYLPHAPFVSEAAEPSGQDVRQWPKWCASNSSGDHFGVSQQSRQQEGAAELPDRFQEGSGCRLFARKIHCRDRHGTWHQRQPAVQMA